MTTIQTPRRRDAAKTRRLLLDAAVRRFTQHGYAATTVRDIADDAGVNVALINRYFGSKEGLFEACLSSSVEELNRSATDPPPSRTAEAIARQMAGPCMGALPHNLVLLLRKSGDETADRIRIELLRSYGARLAAATDSTGADGLLRAQLVIAAAAGIALLYTKSDMTPLTTASEADLIAPLSDLIDALMRSSEAVVAPECHS